MAEPVLLVGDLGGSNARFALARSDSCAYAHAATLRCGDFESAQDAIDNYLSRADLTKPDVICLAVAGPVVDNKVEFLNNDWRLDKATLQSHFPSTRITLLNDFGATACSLPFLEGEDIEPIGMKAYPALGNDDINVAVIGPGTGLGVGGLIRRNGVLHPIAGEGGHIGFAPQSNAQVVLHQQLSLRFERVSNERLLSGPGLTNIYQALQEVQAQNAAEVTASEIFQQAADHGDEIASESVQLFFEILGQVAGDVALAMGAIDGVYIAGGIVPRYPEILKASHFRAGFESKGRHRALLQQIPTWLITHPQPGLIGASYIARTLFDQKRESEGSQP